MTNTEMREKLAELLKTNACPSPFMCDPTCRYYGCGDCFPDRFADHLIANGVTVNNSARPLEEWHEDYGDVLWWKFPIEEPPYVGSPLDTNWPDYHTHWTPITVPEPPKEEKP